MTELGLIPEEWKTTRLMQLMKLRIESVLPENVPDMRYVGLEHIDPSESKIRRWGNTQQVRSAKSHFYTNDILYGKLRPYLDKAALAEWEGVCSTDILVFAAYHDVADPDYLSYLLHTRSFLDHAVATTSGVNHPRTSWSSLSKFIAPLPPLPEQKAIARVLSTIQETIETQDKIIAAARELKKSLMRHLFTYGPVPMSEAENVPLKETGIGPVPEHWNVVGLSQKCDVKGGKRLPKGHAFSDKPTPHPYIRVVDFRNGSVDLSNLKFLTDEDYQTIRRYTINTDEVYISIAGTIGLIGTIPSELNGANLTENAAKLVIKEKNELNNIFLKYALSTENLQQQIFKLTTKTSQPKLALSRIQQIIIPLPLTSEQQEIVNMLSTMDNKTDIEENRKAALQSLFKTILHNLMTGKVRVNHLEATFS